MLPHKTGLVLSKNIYRLKLNLRVWESRVEGIIDQNRTGFKFNANNYDLDCNLKEI